MSKTRRHFSLFVIVLFGALACAQSTRAYDNDTHFWLTYYLAIKVGYTPIQAAQIASADISVDFDKHTEPVLPSPNFKFDIFKPDEYMQTVRSTLHALPLRQLVMDRFPSRREPARRDAEWDPRIETDPEILSFLDDLVMRGQEYRWEQVVKNRDNPGVFLHYLEDKYAHRGFCSYVGHAGYEYVDFLASDPEKAKRMMRDVVNYLFEFKSMMNGVPVHSPDVIANNWKQLSPAVWAEIDATLGRFVQVNLTNGVEETKAMQDWLQAENKLKPGLAREMYKRWKNAQYPDSFKARLVVRDELKLNDDQLPRIWLYDLRQGGFPTRPIDKDSTSDIKVYRSPNIRENFDEKTARDRQNEKLCMPWIVVKATVSEVPRCTEN
jgi:hypothetical protein